MLTVHAEARASGEFIYASPNCEVHIHLQAGRVAWATCSLHPFEFLRQLQALGVERSVLQSVVEECRATRKPLGETLVAWGVVSTTQALEALRASASIAIAGIDRAQSGHALFLERPRYDEYDPQFTFSLDELVTRPRHEQRRAAAIASQVRVASWVAVRDGARLDTAVVVDDIGPPFFEPVDADVDFVGVRGADACHIGTLASASMWCGAPSRTYGSLLSALSLHGYVRNVAQHGTRVEERWTRGDAETVATLSAAVQMSRHVVGAGTLNEEGTLVGACAYLSYEPRFIETLLQQRAALLTRLQALAGPGEFSTLGFHRADVVIGDERHWVFGTQRVGAPWFIVRREASQGIGWACIAAFGRQDERRR
jgi:hypothetical protein